MAKQIYRKPLEKMDFEERKDFIQPPSRDIKGKLGAREIKKAVGESILAFRDTLFVKFNRIVHKLLTGEWINNAKVKESLINDIKQFKTSPKLQAQRNLNSAEEVITNYHSREVIEHTIAEIKFMCNLLKGAIPERDLDEVLKNLKEIADTNRKAHKEELKLYENLGEEGLVRVQEEEEVEEKEEVDMDEKIDLSRMKANEKIPAITREIRQVLRFAKSEPLPPLMKRKGKASIQMTSVDNHTYLTLSLSQNKRDYNRFKELEKLIETNFEKHEFKQVKALVGEFIDLIERALTQKINVKIKAKDQDGKVSSFKVTLPRRELPSTIEGHLNGLRMDKEYLT